MSFPPCAQNNSEFSVKYILYGPFCLITTAFSFICVTLDGWDEVDDYERKIAIALIILITLTVWILLPIFLLLEIIKICFYPFGLIVYMLTKKYYQAYPHDRRLSEIRGRTNSNTQRSSTIFTPGNVPDLTAQDYMVDNESIDGHPL